MSSCSCFDFTGLIMNFHQKGQVWTLFVYCYLFTGFLSFVKIMLFTLSETNLYHYFNPVCN